MHTITPIEASNSLVDLAARIKAEHDAVGNSLKQSVCHAISAGELLIEAKAQPQLKHGQWLPWLASCGISERTAQRYMRVARNKKVVEAKSDTVSDLTLNGALALLTIPGVAEKAVGEAETSEAVRDEAEQARRQVIFDAIKRNGEAIKVLRDKLVPDDFQPERPCPEIKKIFDELLETVRWTDDEFSFAVECGNHDRAFALVTWWHDLSVDMRLMAEGIVAGWEKRSQP
jgi:hypothetical protein